MTNWTRYLIGMLFGMTGEYLYRVETTTEVKVIIIILLITMAIGIIIDLTNKKIKK